MLCYTFLSILKTVWFNNYMWILSVVLNYQVYLLAKPLGKFIQIFNESLGVIPKWILNQNQLKNHWPSETNKRSVQKATN